MTNLKELLKPNKYGTVRRSAVLKLLKQGKLEAKCNYHYTDDYVFDNAVDFKRTDWMPCRLRAERTDTPQGYISFDEDDFSSSYSTGGTRLNEDGTISFSIHSNLNYTLRVKE